MKALISSIELVETGYRVAQVTEPNQIFPVAEGMFWVDCTDDVLADQFWYDPTTKNILEIPKPAPIMLPVTDTGASNA